MAAEDKQQLPELILTPSETKDVATDQLAEWLQDRTFVDYFNVFLSLPTFAQRLVYCFDDKNFEFDPPIARTKHVLERPRLVGWLVTERLPAFLRTDLYREYLLARHLLTVTPHFSTSSHRPDYDKHRELDDLHFVETCIGHVIGMSHFRSFLARSAGEMVLSFWMAIEKFFRIPDTDSRERWMQYREIQVKYFKMVGLDDIKQEACWDVVRDSRGLAPGPAQPVAQQAVDALVDAARPATELTDAERRLADLQNLLLAVLKDYWLQKFLLHQKMIQIKKDSTEEAIYKIQCRSDLAILKDVKNIDKALSLLEGNLKPGNRARAIRAQFSWNHMFPGHAIDESYMQSNEEVITLHNDGTVSVHRPKSKEFEIMLQKYLSDSSDSEGPAPSKSPHARRTIAPVNSAKMVRRDSTPLLEKIKKIQAPTKVLRSNLALFEHIMDLNFETIPHDDINADITPDDRPTTAPPDASTLHQKEDKTSRKKAKLKLPKIIKGKKDNGAGQGESGPGVGAESGVGGEEEGQPPIAEVEDPSPMLGPVRNGPVIETPTYHYTNMCEGYFRYDQRLYVCSVVSDRLAGGPFERYMRKRKLKSGLAALNFWFDAQTYLSKKDADEHALGDYIRFRRSRVMLQRYLTATGDQRLVCVPPGLTQMLARLLLLGRGEELLRDAQDFAIKSIHKHWSNFCKNDRAKFFDATVEPRPRRGVPGSVGVVPFRAGSTPPYFDSQRQGPLPHTPRAASHHTLTSPTPGYTTKNKNGRQAHESRRPDQGELVQGGATPGRTEAPRAALVGCVAPRGGAESPGQNAQDEAWMELLPEKRTQRALQLGLLLSDISEVGLPLETLSLDGLEYDADHQHGSLAINHLVPVMRRDLVELSERTRLLRIRTKAARLAALEDKRVKNMYKNLIRFDDATPYFMKPFRRAGIWYHRPSKPRSFSELIRCDTHVEYFRRFLVGHGADTPVSFYAAVDALKRVREPRQRQTKVSQVVRKYFSDSSEKGIAALDCTAEVIQEIPKMERVTPAMLVSAQACIARRLEDKWFVKYLMTFPDQPGGATESKQKLALLNGRRQWGKGRTKGMWKVFLKIVVNFRRTLLDKKTSERFASYLRHESRKEIDRQNASTGTNYAYGIPVKKVIHNKLVDVTKLVNDLTFLGETERFRIMCDDATEAAAKGSFSYHDQRTLERKAKLIVDCFVCSDLQPKLQINCSPEIADSILDMYNNNLIERGLFYDALIPIFPVMAGLWKTFRKWSVLDLFENLRNSGMLQKQARPKHQIPDFINTRQLKVRRIPTNTHDDPPRMQFTMVHGPRLVVPVYREPVSVTALNRRMTLIPPETSSSTTLLQPIPDADDDFGSAARPVLPPIVPSSRRRLSVHPGKSRTVTSQPLSPPGDQIKELPTVANRTRSKFKTKSKTIGMLANTLKSNEASSPPDSPNKQLRSKLRSIKAL